MIPTSEKFLKRSHFFSERISKGFFLLNKFGKYRKDVDCQSLKKNSENLQNKKLNETFEIPEETLKRKFCESKNGF